MAYVPRRDRVAFTADLARAWIDLAATPAAERRVAIVLANYPNRDGRLGNGVGLDTPAGTVELLHGRWPPRATSVDGIPADGNALVGAIAAGPTNAGSRGARSGSGSPSTTTSRSSRRFPRRCSAAVRERWGGPEGDPYFLSGAGEGTATPRARTPTRAVTNTPVRAPPKATGAGAGGGAGAKAGAIAGKGTGAVEGAGLGACARSGRERRCAR